MSNQELEEIKRYFGVTAESLRHDIQQVAEGHDIVLSQIKDFRKEVKEEFKEVRALISFPSQNSISELALSKVTSLS